MNRFCILVILASYLAGCTQPEKTFDLVIQNVNLFDGSRDRGKVHIAINADTIAAISSEARACERACPRLQN